MRSLASHVKYASIAALLLLFNSAVSLASDIKPGEVVVKHLASIGTAEARNAVKSRVVQGSSTYRVLVGGTGAIDGKFVSAFKDRESNFLFKINATGFRGEQFICDGNKTSVAGTYLDKSRSEFGDFILAQDLVLRENLLGGVWSTGWPLFDLEGRKAKLHSDGMKKLDGKEFIALRYQPKKMTDLEIILYFDPQTYQHVATIYKMEPSGSMEGGETAMAGKQGRHYRLEEHFSDFHTVDGLTLPTHYDVRFTIETENGSSKLIEWEVRAQSIANNMSIDNRSFQVK